MNTFFENLYANRELHAILFGAICDEYGLTLSEMLVLLFLDRNKYNNTATDMVETLKITKSHVSASVRDLEERGYIKGCYAGKNRRSIHLQLCEKSKEVIEAGKRVQNEFVDIICRGFSDEELGTLKDYIRRMTGNVNRYLSAHGDAKGGGTDG